ncbi:hypothetical protein LEMLEM_LOCUS16445, partial [Lemmus lemmus]
RDTCSTTPTLRLCSRGTKECSFLNVCLCTELMTGAPGGQKALDPWNWTYGWLCVTMCECWEPNASSLQDQ